MKSLHIPEPGKIQVNDIPEPLMGAGDILLKISYVGFCGSDLTSYLGLNPMVNYPVIPGHEIAGTIVQIGSTVPDKFKIGDSVTVVPYTSCGSCPSCRRGRPNACQFNQTMGVQRNGAMSELISVPYPKVLVNNKLSMRELALAEPMTVGFHAAGRGRISPDDTVAVLGCGIIGLGAIISAADRGANVIAVDVDDEKLKLAKSLGASHAVNSSKEDPGQYLKKITNGDGPDVMIEAAGKPATYLAAIENVAFTGRVVCIGYAKEDIAFATKLFVQKEMDIMGSRNAGSDDFQDVINFLEKGKLQSENLVSMTVTPEKAAEAMEKWKAAPGEIIKILVKFI